jgi:hypothetical protein
MPHLAHPFINARRFHFDFRLQWEIKTWIQEVNATFERA